MATDEHKKNGEPPAATNHSDVRKDYTSPELIEYGEVAKLTQSFTTVLE